MIMITLLVTLLTLNLSTDFENIQTPKTPVSIDTTVQVSDMLERAIQYRRNREFSKALELLPDIIRIAKERNDRELLEWGYLLSAHSYLGILEYPLAEEYYRKALSIIEPNDLQGFGTVYNNLGNFYRITGNMDLALEYMFKSISYNEQIADNRMAIAINYITISQIYAQNHDYANAILYNQKAQLAYNDGKKDVLYISILIVSGRLAEQLGYHDTALAHFKEVNAVAAEINSRGHYIDSYFNIGLSYMNLKDFENAESYFQTYLRYIDSIESQLKWNRFLYISNFYSVIGNHDFAFELHKRAVEESRGLDISMNQVLLLRNEGQILRRVGRNYEANQAFRKIFENDSFNRVNVYLPVNLWEKSRNMFYLDRKRAFELAELAIRETERERRQIGFGSSVTSGFYNQYFDYFVILAHEYTLDGNYLKAAETLELARSRAFRDDLVLLNTKNTQEPDSELYKELLALNGELHKLEQEILTSDIKGSNQLEVQRSNLERRIHVLTRQIYNQEADFLTNFDSPVIDLDAAIQSLKNNEAILQFAVSEDRSFALLMTSSGFYVHNIPLSRKEMATYISSIRDEIQQKTAIPDLNNMLDEAGKLFLGTLPLSNIKSLIVIQDGPIHYLPLSALRFNNKYLIEDKTIRATPSLSIRDILLNRSFPNNEGVLALVNPDFGTQNLLSSVIRSEVRPLPFTELEGRMIIANYPGRVELLNGKRANEQVFTGKYLSQFRIIHLATHGILDDRNSRLSGIVLSAPEGSTDADDGFLRVGEIYNLNLNADLVVLSACNTGIGQIYSGEGVMGFQRAFMYAGAQSVAVSLWNIYDRNTALLMRYFYTEIGASIKSNTTPDYNYALRKAKLTLLNQNDTAHPVYWGSFVIYGI